MSPACCWCAPRAANARSRSAARSGASSREIGASVRDRRVGAGGGRRRAGPGFRRMDDAAAHPAYSGEHDGRHAVPAGPRLESPCGGLRGRDLAAGGGTVHASLPLCVCQCRRCARAWRKAAAVLAGTLWRRFGSNLVVLELALRWCCWWAPGCSARASTACCMWILDSSQIIWPPWFGRCARSPAMERTSKCVALGRQIVSRIGSLPGVKSVGIASRAPRAAATATRIGSGLSAQPYHGEHNEVNERDVSSGYFATLQARLLRGRYFTDAEDASKPQRGHHQPGAGKAILSRAKIPSASRLATSVFRRQSIQGDHRRRGRHQGRRAGFGNLARLYTAF